MSLGCAVYRWGVLLSLGCAVYRWGVLGKGCKEAIAGRIARNKTAMRSVLLVEAISYFCAPTFSEGIAVDLPAVIRLKLQELEISVLPSCS